MKDRRYDRVLVDRIVVPNSRDREPEQFAENVTSIGEVGLLKPVLLNERFVQETGNYELICGEGRLLAHRRLGKAEIAAELIDCDRERAYLLSLIENIARVPPHSVWFAREMKRLRDAGMTLGEIRRIVGKPEKQISGYITLVERGEERLLQGVEHGDFPITLAVEISKSDEAGTQNLLMDAFDQGLLNSLTLRIVNKVLKNRRNRPSPGREPGAPAQARAEAAPEQGLYTVEELKRDIAETTREKNAFVRETSIKESRLVALLDALKELRASDPFMALLHSEGLAEIPALEGSYGGLAEPTRTEPAREVSRG
jgi:ParB family chromosome partitioning protein